MKAKNIVLLLATLAMSQVVLAAKPAKQDVAAKTATPATVAATPTAMSPSKDIIDNAMSSKDHSTLVTAIKNAGLVETLKGPGPFTVFAPTNEAFNKLPKETVSSLMKPENKASLSKLLTYHVVAGKMSANDIVTAIKSGKGKATLKTVAGGTLTAKLNGSNVTLTDEKGTVSTVKVADAVQKNGVIHSVDTVVQPK